MTVVGSRAKIGDRYELIERVAVGGMGEVWRAVDGLLRRPVAVKVLRSEYANDPQFRENLRQEARASAGVAHPNVAWVFDYGEEDDGDGNRFAYVVMELVEGESLGSLLARRRRLSAAQTMQVVAQVAEALRAAHERQLVHRDIKPGNLLVRPDGVVKITDFGIAHAADAAPAVPAGTTFGSIAYISPEQARGADTTSASDVYSLGVVAYECLAGRLPFADVDPRQLARAHVERVPPPLPADVPPAVAGFVLRMLAKDSARRPPSARAVAQEAMSWLAYLGERQPLAEAMVGWTPRPAQRPASSVPDLTGVVPTAGAAGPVPTVAAAAGDPAVTRPLWGDTSAFLPLAPPARPPHASRRRRRRLLRSATLAAGVAAAVAVPLLVLDKPSGAVGLSAPALVGKPVATARADLAAVGLRAAVVLVDRPGAPGRVIGQSPAAGRHLRRGATVDVQVPSGFVDLDPTTVENRSSAQARAALAALGLRAVLSVGPATGAPAGTVTGVDPAGRLAVGTTVTLTVAGAPTPSAPPSTAAAEPPAATGGPATTAAPAPAAPAPAAPAPPASVAGPPATVATTPPTTAGPTTTTTAPPAGPPTTG